MMSQKVLPCESVKTIVTVKLSTEVAIFLAKQFAHASYCDSDCCHLATIKARGREVCSCEQ